MGLCVQEVRKYVWTLREEKY